MILHAIKLLERNKVHNICVRFFGSIALISKVWLKKQDFYTYIICKTILQHLR